MTTQRLCIAKEFKHMTYQNELVQDKANSRTASVNLALLFSPPPDPVTQSDNVGNQVQGDASLN